MSWRDRGGRDIGKKKKKEKDEREKERKRGRGREKEKGRFFFVKKESRRGEVK